MNTSLLKLSGFIIAVLMSLMQDLSAQQPGFRSFAGTSTITSGFTTIIIKNGSFINDGIYNASEGNNVTITGNTPQLLGGTGNSEFNDLTINSSGGIVITGSELSVRGVLLCNGTLETNGKLVLLSTSERTALIDGSGTGTVTGNVTLQRYLEQGSGYKYLSSAFSSATIGEIGDDIDLLSPETGVYKFDESRTTSGWVYYKDPANPMNPLEGYAVNLGADPAPKTIDLSGVVNNGTLSVELYNHNNLYTEGFNLVGNPYPSPIDWDAPSGWTRNNIDDAVYYFRASETDQYGGSYSSYMAGISSDGVASNIIPSMQGFFVHVSDGTYPVAGAITVGNEARVKTASTPFLKSAAATNKSLIRLIAGYSDDTLSYDPFVIYYDENSTLGFDGQLDALKVFNTDASVTNFYVFGNDGRKLSIDAIPFTGDSTLTLRLGLYTEREGEVEFRIRDLTGIYMTMSISLTDQSTGIITELSLMNSYRVTLPAGDYQDRFLLNLTGVKTHVEGSTYDQPAFLAYCSYGILKIKTVLYAGTDGILEVFDMTGRVLYRQRTIFTGYDEFYPGLADGLYFIRFISGGEVLTRRLYFHNF
jgi:hypothetical protein